MASPRSLVLGAKPVGLVAAPSVPALGVHVEVVGHAALALALAPVGTQVDASRGVRSSLCRVLYF